MTLLPITLIKGDKIDDKLDYGDKLPKNMFAVKKEILGAAGYMQCFPGLALFAQCVGSDRGGFYNDYMECHYRVSKTRLLSIDSAGTVSDLGFLPGAEQVRIKELYSVNTQGIVANSRLYLYDTVHGLVTVKDSVAADITGLIDGIWIDGYYLVTDGEYLMHTKLGDEDLIETLAYSTADFLPDRIVGIEKTVDNKVLVFGRFSMEYFYNAELDNFAFKRIESRSQSIGLVATHAKIQSSSNFFIVGSRRNENLGVYLVNFGLEEKVSTKEVDNFLESYTENELFNLRLESCAFNGESFILIHLPEETLCLNLRVLESTGPLQAWAILSTRSAANENYRAINGVLDPRNGKWIYGDKFSDQVGFLDPTVFTQYDELQEWLLYTPLVTLETASINALTVKNMPGHFEEATVAVSLTKDGVTYGTEYWQTYGKSGIYDSIFQINRLGYVKNVIGFKLRGITASKMAFALLSIDYD